MFVYQAHEHSMVQLSYIEVQSCACLTSSKPQHNLRQLQLQNIVFFLGRGEINEDTDSISK